MNKLIADNNKKMNIAQCILCKHCRQNDLYKFSTSFKYELIFRQQNCVEEKAMNEQEAQEEMFEPVIQDGTVHIFYIYISPVKYKTK